MKKRIILFLTAMLCINIFGNTGKAAETDTVSPQEKSPLEITNYLQDGQAVVEAFAMTEISQDDESYIDGYTSEGLYYSPGMEDQYRIRNQENQEATFYGIHLGESAESFRAALEANGWMEVYETLYTALIGEEKYALSMGVDESGNVSSWFVSNYIEGLDLLEFWAKYDIEHSENDWKKAYLMYIEETEDQLSDPLAAAYFLIYVDADGIPELLIDYGTSSDLCTFDGEELQTLRMYNSSIRYIERENNIRENGVDQDTYFDNIYAIEEGKFVRKHQGTYSMSNISESRNWDGKKVSQAEYEIKLTEEFDESREADPYEKGIIRPEIIREIQKVE